MHFIKGFNAWGTVGMVHEAFSAEEAEAWLAAQENARKIGPRTYVVWWGCLLWYGDGPNKGE